MSKFIERLKKVSQPPPPPMGFGASKAAADRPKIQLVALVPDTGASLLGQLSTADAVIVSSIRKTNPEKTWGLWLKKGEPEETDRAIKAKVDFVALPFEGAVLSPELKIGKVLQMDASATDIELRAANDLPVDAFIISQPKPGPLTWQRLMLFTRFGGLLNKPVLVTVTLSATANELQLIWEAGISGIIVEAADEAALESFTKLRQVVDGLPFPVKKRKDRMTPTLPAIAAPTGEHDEEPDEDDDDE